MHIVVKFHHDNPNDLFENNSSKGEDSFLWYVTGHLNFIYIAIKFLQAIQNSNLMTGTD